MVFSMKSTIQLLDTSMTMETPKYLTWWFIPLTLQTWSQRVFLKHSYGSHGPFIDDLPSKIMIFHSYANLPEANMGKTVP